jgi:predicted porin
VQAGFSQASVNRFLVASGDRGTGATNAGTTIDGTSLGNRELNATITNTKTGTTVGAGFGSTAIRNIWAAFDPAGGTNLVGNILTNDAQFSSNRATGFGVAQKLGDVTVGAAISQNNRDYTSSSSTNALANEKTSTGYTLNLGYAKGPAAFAAATQEVKVKTNAATGTTSLTTNTATNSAICTLGGGTFTAIGSTSAVSGNGDATNIASCALANTAATDIKRTTNIVAGSYDFGVAKVFANYGSVKTDDAAGASAAGEGKRSAYVLGTQIPVGKATLFALYSDGTQTQATTAGTGAVKRDITGYTVGGRYAFSKRTFAYAAAGETKLDVDTNSANGDRNFGIKVKQATAGLVHSF